MRLAICLCVYEYALEEECVGRMRVRWRYALGLCVIVRSILRNA